MEAEKAEREDFCRVAELIRKITEAEQKLEAFKAKMKEMQGEKSLLKEEVDAEDIAEVVAKWTGNVSKMLQSDLGSF